MKDNAIERFRKSKEWRETYGRICLPKLVQLVEQRRDLQERKLTEFTYKDLAIAVGQPNHAHPIEHALGSIGDALRELNTQPQWKLEEVPPIQLIVWSKGKNSPGDDAFGYLGLSKADTQDMSAEKRKALARLARNQILAYPHWRKVLFTLGLEPLVAELPPIKAIVEAPDKDGFGGGESEFHKRLKSYVAKNPALLGLSGMYEASFEEVLSSGDRVDVMLREITTLRRVCVEVKSRISVEQDLIRGLFQCVKYKAVLEAEEKYQMSRESKFQSNGQDVILVVESALSREANAILQLLNVRVVVVKMHPNF